MLFTKTISIDSKDRCLLLAKNTCVELGDNLYLFYYDAIVVLLLEVKKAF